MPSLVNLLAFPKYASARRESVKLISAVLFVILALSICNNYVNKLSDLRPRSIKQPNILFILADDLGYGNVGYHGSSFKTPTLDKLAEEGVKLENYYVQPICTPSRSQLMTGRYQIHTGMQHEVIEPGQPWGLPLQFQTLGDKLKELGYSTHIVGKWHLGFHTRHHTPTYRGFDSFYGYYTSMTDYFTHAKHRREMEGIDLHNNLKLVKDKNGTYSPSLFLQRAEHIAATHNKDKAPQSYIDQYSSEKNKRQQAMGAVVMYMDYVVKNITDAFKKHGLWNNTILIFSSDNGGPGQDNLPLRGGKWTLWEGGIRAVGFVNSPLLKKKSYTNRGLIHISDWFPTLVHLAGGDTTGMNLDGIDQWDTISLNKSSRRQEILINIDPLHDLVGERRPGSKFDNRVRAGIRSGDFKLMTGNVDELRGHQGKPEKNIQLFDIASDPTESRDLSESHPGIVDRLLNRLAFYNSTAVPCVFTNEEDPRANPKYHGGAWMPWM